MKSALDEQGFKAKSHKMNRLVAWEESERNTMHKILKRHGFERDVKMRIILTWMLKNSKNQKI